MTIFFDLDGPILDVSEKYYRLYCDIVREYGGCAISKEEYWSGKRQRISETAMLQKSGLSGTETDFQVLRKQLIETDSYLYYDVVFAGVESMLATLKEFHQLMLVTLRHNRASLMHELDRLKLLPYFQTILSASSDSTEHEHSDTKVRLVREHFSPGNVTGWFIGDTATDVLTGKKLGLHTAAILYGIRTATEFETLAPDMYLHNPEELVNWSKSLVERRKDN